MIVVDMESSGVEPHKNSLLSVGAFEFANPKNKFYEECRVWEGAHIDNEALAVNGFKREDIEGGSKKQSDKDLLSHFLSWTETCAEKTIAGQNPSTDRDFLKYTAERYHVNWPFAHRTIDLHSICYFHMVRRGITPPVKNNHSALNLDGILTYVGIPTEPKPHNGLMGAKVEAEAFSRLLTEKWLFSEFERYPIPWLKKI
ncbi:MAG: hypothetical protein ABI430_04870 [Candidatus Taylorbacteria bacterium]